MESQQQRDKSEYKSALTELLNQRVVIQEKGGGVVSGLFVLYSGEGYLKLTDVTITGRSRKASPPFILVHQSSLTHIHPEVEVETVKP